MKLGEYTSFIVYKHTSPSGKVYIGITRQSQSGRFGHNGNGYKNNEYFRRAIEKYGWSNFRHEILYSGLSKEIACKIEIELIAKYNSANKEYGYNISLGGEHSAPSEETRKKMSKARKGKTHSGETRRKMSEAKKNMSEEIRRKISKTLKGHVVSKEARRKMSEAKKNMSEETRRKLSEANKGKTLSEETRKKIRNAMLKHPVMCVETGVVYESIMGAQRETGISESAISKVCRNKLKTTGGLHWKFIIKEE